MQGSGDIVCGDILEMYPVACAAEDCCLSVDYFEQGWLR